MKTIVRPGTRYVGQFAVMRKVEGPLAVHRVRALEREARYTVLAQGQLCTSCHVMARANDYVFTKR